MAKRRKSSGGGTKTVVVRERSAAPVIKVSAPRAAPVKRRGRRRSSGGGGGRGAGGSTGAMTPQKSGSLALGGFIYGYLEKNFPQIPTLPIVGKSGAIAIIAYFAGGKHAGIIADVGNAASVIAGYSFGSTGKVSGNLAPQVSGVAAQV